MKKCEVTVSKLSNFSKLKNKLKRFLSVIAAAFLLVISGQVKAYTHIPLKGLFTVFKNNDIGFAHALLHSGWIENVYQYGPGKPYRKVAGKRNRVQFKSVEKDDAVANLVRKFWFRVGEHHQLLPSKFGCLAYISNAEVGTLFGKLINYLYMNCPKKAETELINELLKYDPGYKQFKLEIAALLRELDEQECRLENKKFDALKQAREIEKKEMRDVENFFKEEIVGCKEAIAKASKKWGDKPGFSKKKKEIEDEFKWGEYIGEYNRILREIKKKVYEHIDKEVLKEYCNIQSVVKRMDAAIVKKVRKKTDEIKKSLFAPIQKALKFCKAGDVYMPRTVEAILWALFFHKLDKLRSREDKIAAINDCLAQIDLEFKHNSQVLRDLYTKKDFEMFEGKIKDLGANVDIFTCYEQHKQIHEVCAQYDIGLHYVIGLVTCGDFPPIITRGDYGYEYEPGKLSEIKPDCYENAILDAISILWYNKEKKCFDDSLFSDHIIKYGEGFQRLREALKYVYLADSKGVKASEYTCTSEHGRFTSLGMLKKLGKITVQEVEKLDISEVPVSYITRPEIKQEFLNIVSGVPGVLYCSEISGEKVFELESDADSFIKVFNYFYGTDVCVDLGGQAVGLSTDERKICFEKIGDQGSLQEINISVINSNKSERFDLIVSIDDHALVFPERARCFFGALKGDIIGVALEKILSNSLDIVNKERCASIFTLLVNKRLLERQSLKSLNWQVPILNLAYYGITPKIAKDRMLLIRDVLTWGVQLYSKLEGFACNLLESWSFNEQKLEYELSKNIIETGFYAKELLCKKFVDEKLLDNPAFYSCYDKVKNILRAALKFRAPYVAQVILDNPDWRIYEWDLAEALYLTLAYSGDVDIALKIMNHSKFTVNEPEIGKALVFAFWYRQKNPLEKSWEKIVARIVQDPTFTHWGSALEEALRRRCKFVALKIVKHENFDPNQDDYYMKQAWGFMLQRREYHDVALQIINNPEFDARKLLIKDVLVYIKKLKKSEPKLRYELQKIAKIIKEKRGCYE